MSDDLLGFSQALEIVLAQAADVRPGAVEIVALEDSAGRVVAEPVICDRDQPPFDRSTRDGFAVRADSGLIHQVVGLVRAGDLWTGGELSPGSAVEIMTGAPVPAGADAVVMVEHAQRSGERIALSEQRRPISGQNVVRRGAEMGAGQTALPRGTPMHAAEIAIAASVGAAQISVFRRPEVALLATGDELVELGDDPAPQQIRNSNSYALAAMVKAAGGIAHRLPIARDSVEALERALEAAAGFDLLLLSGGVSAGKYDLVEDVLTQRGARFHFTGVRMQPGKPVVFGSLPRAEFLPPVQSPFISESPEAGLRQQIFFGLPGNPVSTQVTFLCFVAPLLRALAGEIAPEPRFAQATLSHGVEGRLGLTRLLPALLQNGATQPEVELVPWHGSGDLAANARANCYAMLPGDRNSFAAGEVISILLR